MSKQNNVTIHALREQLISELEKNGYTRKTIQLYTEHVNQIMRYMDQKHISAYSDRISDEFYREVVEHRNYSEKTRRFYRTVIRRSMTCILGMDLWRLFHEKI